MSAWTSVNWLRRFVCAILLLITGWQARHWYEHQTGANKLHHPLEVTLWLAAVALAVALFVYQTKRHSKWSFALGAVIGVVLVGWWHHLHGSGVNANDFTECFVGVLIVTVLLIGILAEGKQDNPVRLRIPMQRVRERAGKVRAAFAGNN